MRRLLGGTAAVLLLSLLPLALLAPYTGPSADDFGYGAPVYYALQAGQGLPGLFSALGENLRYTTQYWQGTFASVLLFSLHPGVFSPGLYALTPFVMLAACLAPVFLTLRCLSSANPWGRGALGCVIGLLSVQLLPSPADGLYWWNGAAHYLLFWCLGVLVILWQIRLLRRGTGAGWRLRAAAGGLLAFFVGGGNYSTALVTALAALAVFLWALYAKAGFRGMAAPALATLSAAGGLLLSAAAPGNVVRQAGLTGLPPLAAILTSLQQAAGFLLSSLTPPVLAALLLCVPLFLWTVRACGYSFPLPFLVVPAGFCLYAALLTPPLYAMGKWDVPRMNNLFWLAGLFVLFGGAFYLAGWAARRFRLWERPLPAVLPALSAAGAVLLAAALAGSWPSTAAGRAWDDLESGAAAAYQKEAQERAAIYADKGRTPRFTPPGQAPLSFHASHLLTWNSDVLVDGVPADLPCYHACGGEVTYVGLERAERFWGLTLSPEDFSKTFRIGPELCVPLRELCDRLGFSLIYDLPCDTLLITTTL